MRRILLLAVAFLLACSGGDDAKKTEGGEAAPDAAATAPAGGATGMQVEHLVEGTGPSPAATDVVVVHYHGTFQDGTVFDSSVQRGQPARFPLNRVIPCWTQGVQQMKVGGKAKLTCGPDVAYGPAGAPPRIPPNATLLFEVELLGIENAQ
jgi:FKBP-type peptidyl-prolyl cis-trans isomerase FkpA